MLRKTYNYRGQRNSDRSKSSKFNLFDPYESEIDNQYLNQHYSFFNSNKGQFVIKECPLNPNFIIPVTKAEVRSKLNSLPSQFLEGLKGVMLLGGSKKQLKTAWGNLSCYGVYSDSVIFLLPFPIEQLITCSRTLPPPHIKQDYEKAGAIFTFENQRWYKHFTRSTLKTFYLNDVLIHELGHHVDRYNKNDSDAEKYAEWFAREYGYK